MIVEPAPPAAPAISAANMRRTSAMMFQVLCVIWVMSEGVSPWVFLTIGKGTKNYPNGARAELERRGIGGVTVKDESFLQFNKIWGKMQ